MKWKYIRYIVVVFSLLIFFYMAYLYVNNRLYHLDSFVYDNLIKIERNSITKGLIIITNLVSPVIILGTIIAMTVFMKRKQAVIMLTLNLILTVCLNLSLKYIFIRTRPNIKQLVTESGYSFPSGHAMISLAFYGFIIYLIYTSKSISRQHKKVFIPLIGLLIFLIGISRIYLGVHYVSDVIAGYSISLAYLIIYIEIIKKKVVINEKKQISK